MRLKGDYLAIVTLAFGEIIKNIANAIYLGFDEKGAHISLKNTSALNLSDKGFVVIKGAQEAFIENIRIVFIFNIVSNFVFA